MKKIAFISMFVVLVATMAHAQTGMHIKALFDGRYKHSSAATEIVVTGKKAQQFNLALYHSLSVTNMSLAPAIMKAVVADGVQATSKEVEYRGGKLYYGYYVFARRQGNNRFVFYLDQSLARKQPVDKVTLIYMEGDVSSAYIKSLIRQ